MLQTSRDDIRLDFCGSFVFIFHYAVQWKFYFCQNSKKVEKFGFLRCLIVNPFKR